jgi:hypothetical protein
MGGCGRMAERINITTEKKRKTPKYVRNIPHI